MKYAVSVLKLVEEDPQNWVCTIFNIQRSGDFGQKWLALVSLGPLSYQGVSMQRDLILDSRLGSSSCGVRDIIMNACVRINSSKEYYSYVGLIFKLCVSLINSMVKVSVCHVCQLVNLLALTLVKLTGSQIGLRDKVSYSLSCISTLLSMV